MPELGIIGGADGPTAVFVAGSLWPLAAAYLLAMNVATFAVYGLDKRFAKTPGHRRVRERTLLLLAALGGSLGALAAMRVFRHKTKHKKFVFGVPALLVLQLALAAYLTHAG